MRYLPFVKPVSVTIVAILMVAAIFSLPVQAGDCGTNWERVTPLWPQRNLSCVTYGDGNFVAAGEYGVIMSSQDGLEWYPRDSGVTKNISSITYGNSKFVAVLQSFSHEPCVVLTSPDGRDWQTQCLQDRDFSLNAVAFGGGRFVAAGSPATILSSPDGIEWNRHYLGIYEDLLAVTYGNGLFVAAGDAGKILTSPDGETWTERDSSTTDKIDMLFFTGKYFMALSNYSFVTSEDGITWVQSPHHLPSDFFTLATDGHIFVAAGWNGFVFTSQDTATWSGPIKAAAYTLNGLVYGDGKFVGAGGLGSRMCIAESVDGSAWVEPTSSSEISIALMSAGGDRLIASGHDDSSRYQRILTSSDGLDWRVNYLPEADVALNSIAYDGGRFIAAGTRSTVFESYGGDSWEKVATLSKDIRRLAYGGGVFVGVVPFSDIILSSSDGRSWTETQLKHPDNLFSVSYGASQFVAVGLQGAVLTSPDGQNWTRRLWGYNFEFKELAYGSSNFVAIGETSSQKLLLVSPDGISWVAFAFESGISPQSISYGNWHFVIPCYNGIVLASKDGISWWINYLGQQDDIGLYSAACGSGAMLVGGYRGTIYRSECDYDVAPPVISSMAKSGSPFKITVRGGNFQDGCRVFINGEEWTNITRSGGDKIVIKGGNALKKKVPKGTLTIFEFLNPDSGLAGRIWKW